MKRLDGLKAFLQGLRPSLRTSLVALLVCLGLIGGSHAFFSGGAPAYAQPRSGQGLTAFRSDKELRTFLKGLRARQQGGFTATNGGPPPPAPPPPPAVAYAPSADASAEALVVTGSRVAAPSITNNQEADVDEGGIVKMSGDIMVILRRGRLFTVSLAGGETRPIDWINAYPPGVSGSGDWYDEMLVSGNRIVVVGYSYARGGTEINRFRIDPGGRLRFEDAYHLRSNDYYSSRNYASRLIGDRLIFYTPLYLGWNNDPLEALPGIRRWQGETTDRAFRRIATARQVFIAPMLRRSPDAEIDTLHSVTSCNLTAPVLDCSATAVLGPSSRTFYVSGEAVYLWVANQPFGRERRTGAAAAVYRLPLGRERPSAVAARGMPVDQFSFQEDRREGMLNVLVRSEGGGDAMWRPEFTSGSVALLRLPLSEFGDGSREARRSDYVWLPQPRGETWDFRNRFVGEHVVYGSSVAATARGGSGGGSVVAARVRDGRYTEFPLSHGVGRIEAMGPDALIVGGDGRDLLFTPIELRRGREPRLGDRYALPGAQEGESRSHAFFFRPDPRSREGETGTLGLPVARAAAPEYRRFFGTSAAMLFLHRRERGFAPAGELAANARGTVDDACQASCVDWYGNARPIFLGERIFALLGYELVEGEMERSQIRERGRVNFAPPPQGRRR